MSKEYTEQEIDELVKEVKEQLLDPVLDLAKAELLAKSEKEKKDPLDEASAKPSAPGEGDKVAALEKADEDAPPAEPANDEKPAMDAKPAEDKAPAAVDDAQAPEAAPEGEGQDLQSAYAELSDEDLMAHWDAIKSVMMARVPQDQPADAPPADMASEAPAQNSMPMEPAPQADPVNPMMAQKSEELSKAEAKISALETQVHGLLDLMESFVKAPQRKSVTSVAQVQFLQKSEPEAPAVKQLSKAEVVEKLQKAAKSPALSDADGRLITRYFTSGGNVELKELEHLLK